MEYNLQFMNSENNKNGFSNISFEPYIDEISENQLPITCSQQHLTYENTRNINKTNINNETNNYINEYNSYDSINSQNSFIELRDTNNLNTFRRSSLRGRRRYRRTLLRNYEQSFTLNTNNNINYNDITDESDINTQRRVFLRNTNITGNGNGNGNGIGINHSNIKFNTNYDQLNKVNKPSWDGGRLVKLLQGHGLNIDNYEKENNRLMNRNWNSKQLSNTIKHQEESKIFKDTNRTQIKIDENCIYLNNNHNLKDNIHIDSNSQKINNIIENQFQKFSLNNEYLQQNQLIDDTIESIKLNNDQQNINQSNFSSQKNFIINNNKYDHNNEQKSFISNIQYCNNYQINNNNYQINNNHHQNINNNQNNINNNQSINEYIDHKNFVEHFFFDSSKQNLKSNQIITNNHIENITKNINNQNTFNLEDFGEESISNIISCHSNSFFNTSHEELFVTLGDTPTSKSGYNISSLFIPNQD